MTDGDEKWLALQDFPVKPNPAKETHLPTLKTKLFQGFQSQTCIPFQLTFKGFRQHHATGLFIRNRYWNHFTEQIQASDILIQSTSYSRTVQSSASFALGFIPSDSVKRAEVPIYCSPGAMLATPPPGRTVVYERCRNLYQVKANELKDPGYVSKVAQLKPLFKDIAFLINLKRDSLELEDIFDNVWGIVCHDLPLPCRQGSCLEESLISKGAKAVDWSFSNKWSQGSSVLAVQPFLFHSIINEIDLAIRGESSFKFLFSCAHDSTLTAVLASLNIEINFWLPYASRIILEVWKDIVMPDHHYIRFLLNGKSVMKQFAARFPRDVFELDGELLSYDYWRESMVTGVYRDKDSYHERCNQVTSIN